MATVAPPAQLQGEDVFISYSRHDKPIVEQLYQSLREQGRDPWVDWVGIAPSVEWLARVYSAIDRAQVFIFVISPDSLRSQVPILELSHALAAHKKIVPVRVREFSESDVPGQHRQVVERLLKLQHVFLRAEDSYANGLAQIVEAIDTDYEHTRLHTEHLRQAREWSAHGRDPSQLLRGEALQQAERWLRGIGGKQPPASEFHIDFIEESRRAEQKRRRLLASTLAGSTIVLGVLLIATFYLKQLSDKNAELAQSGQGEARRQTNLAESRLNDANRALAASNFSNFKLLREKDPQQALAYLVKAIRIEPSLRNFHDILFDSLIRTSYALPTSPLISLEEDVKHVEFSNDGKCFIAATNKEVQVWTLVDGTTRLLRKLILADKIVDAVFSPDGSALLISAKRSLQKIPLAQPGKGESKQLVGFKEDEAIRILTPFQRGNHIVLLTRNSFQVWDWTSLSASTPVLKAEKIGLAQFRGVSQFCLGRGSTGKDKPQTLQLFGVDGNLKANVSVSFPRNLGDDVSTDRDFRVFAAETFPQELSIWLPNGQLYVERKRFASRFLPPVFSPSAQVMAVVENRGLVHVIDFHRKRDSVAPIVAKHVPPDGLRFSPDGTALLIADGKTARLWDVRNSIGTGDLVHYPKGFTSDFEAIEKTRDESLIITRSPSTKTVTVLDLASLKDLQFNSYRLDAKEPCISAAISPTGKFAALATSSSVILYERNKVGFKPVLTSVLVPSPSAAILSFSEDEERLVAATTTQTVDGLRFDDKRHSSKIRRFSLRGTKPIDESDGMEGAITEMHLSRDGSKIALKRTVNAKGSSTKLASTYDFAERKMSGDLECKSLQISPAGDNIFLGGETCSLLEPASGTVTPLTIPYADAFWLEAKFSRSAKSLFVRAAGAIGFQGLGKLDTYMRIDLASGRVSGAIMTSSARYGTPIPDALVHWWPTEPLPSYPWSVSTDERYVYQHANDVAEVWSTESGEHLLPPLYLGGLKAVVFRQEGRRITCLAGAAALIVDVCGIYDSDTALGLCDFVESWCGWTIDSHGSPTEKEILERNVLLSQFRKSGDAGKLMKWFSENRSSRVASPYSEQASPKDELLDTETILHLFHRPDYDENPGESFRTRESTIKRILENGGVFASTPAQ